MSAKVKLALYVVLGSLLGAAVPWFYYETSGASAWANVYVLAGPPSVLATILWAVFGAGTGLVYYRQYHR